MLHNEDEVHRYYGEFYTPTVWVDEAHKLLEQELGENWRQEYVVWDPCCGTGNLTRDYQFKKLFCSTLNPKDIEVMESHNYNPEAVKFQYGFLNDDIYPPNMLPMVEVVLEKQAPELVQLLQRREGVVFIMNPPHAVPHDWFGKSDLGGTSKTKVNQMMSREAKNLELLKSNFTINLCTGS